MNSIMVPALAGQIYAMAGMETRLNLEADAPGEFTGRNTMFSGTGFSGQHFEARAMSDEDFSEWVAATKGSNHELTQDTYVEIAKPSQNVPVIRFSDVVPGLFDSILAKYRN